MQIKGILFFVGTVYEQRHGDISTCFRFCSHRKALSNNSLPDILPSHLHHDLRYLTGSIYELIPSAIPGTLALQGYTGFFTRLDSIEYGPMDLTSLSPNVGSRRLHAAFQFCNRAVGSGSICRRTTTHVSVLLVLGQGR